MKYSIFLFLYLALLCINSYEIYSIIMLSKPSSKQYKNLRTLVSKYGDILYEVSNNYSLKFVFGGSVLFEIWLLFIIVSTIFFNNTAFIFDTNPFIFALCPYIILYGNGRSKLLFTTKGLLYTGLFYNTPNDSLFVPWNKVYKFNFTEEKSYCELHIYYATDNCSKNMESFRLHKKNISINEIKQIVEKQVSN